MAYYESSRLFEELLSVTPSEVLTTHNSTSTSGKTAGANGNIKHIISWAFNLQRSKTDIEETKYSGPVFTLKRIHSLLADNDISLTSAENAKNGDVTYVTGQFTCGALPITYIDDDVKNQFAKDNKLTHKDKELFHIFGGIVNSAQTSTNPSKKKRVDISKNVLLLGSIDNIQMFRAHCTSDKTKLANDFPNSYPSTPEAAEYLLKEIYQVAIGPRAQENRPSIDEELAALRDMISRTIRGGGCGYPSYYPNNRVRHDYHMAGYFRVVYSTPKTILLRPLIIQ